MTERQSLETIKNLLESSTSSKEQVLSFIKDRLNTIKLDDEDMMISLSECV